MRYQYLAAAAIVALSVFSSTATAQERTDQRVVEQDNSAYTDLFVDRAGPNLYDISAISDFDQKQLGVLLPSYGRASLYLAYRALTHNTDVLARQFHDTPPDEYINRLNNRSLAVMNWIRTRQGFANKKLTQGAGKFLSENNNYRNCNDGAFNLAVETLQSLTGNKQITPQDVQEWIAGQDIVFEQCGNESGAAADMPHELGAGTPLYVRQLREYQIAAANFYHGNYTEALRRFDAIAANATHPMRAWANLAAMRSLLRMGSTSEQNQATDEKQRTMQQLYDKIAARAKLVLADNRLKNIQEPTRKLLRQAETIMLPEQAYATMSAELGRFDKDFRIDGELFRWATIGDKLFDQGMHDDLMADLRRRYEYFDWIRTIQGCTDAPWSPNYHPGSCNQEQQHALERWQASKSRIWLVATLITAQQMTPPVEKALAAAHVGNQDKEYLTVRYYTVRLLRRAGRFGAAAALINEVIAPPNYAISDRMLKNSSGASNLFKQEALALAKNDRQALPYLLRDSSRRLGADGDELLNRRLSSEDLLRLAENPATDRDLAEQLLVASWWRSDMVGKRKLADQAAQLVGNRIPNLSAVTNDYLHADNDDDRHFILAKAALHYRISPRVYAVTQSFASQSAPRDAQFWCSFSSADYAGRTAIERIPTPVPELTANAAERDAELVSLRQIGSGADWMARIALARAKTYPADASVHVMLQAVVKSGNRNCGSAEGAELVNAARQVLGDKGNQNNQTDQSNQSNPTNQDDASQTHMHHKHAKSPASQPAPAQGSNAASVSESDARSLYEHLKIGTASWQEYHVAHIMLRSEDEATSALANIRNGRASFEQIAKVSMDTASANKGGDLGWALLSTYAQPFADAVGSMKTPGLYDHPVETQFGWHVIRLVGLRPYVLPSFEDLRPSLEERIRKLRSH